MTPQERRLLDELFDRLASLENAPRDPDAVDAINEGLDRAPNALYALVQSVLVQDEALKRADARIRELEDELGITAEQPNQGGSFLDSMRDNLAGRRGGAGSVPSVSSRSPWDKGPVLPADSPWSKGPLQTGRSDWQDGPPQGRPNWNDAPPQGPNAQWNPGGPQAGAPGGSFLGTAAAAAAGTIGGSLLMNSIRGLLGGQQGQGQAHAAFDPSAGAGAAGASSSSGGKLAQDAGLGDIGGSNRLAAHSDSGGASSQRTGLFDSFDGHDGAEDMGDDSDIGGDFDGGDDTA